MIVKTNPYMCHWVSNMIHIFKYSMFFSDFRSSSMDHKNSLNDGKSQDSGHTSNNQGRTKDCFSYRLTAYNLSL